MVNLKTKYLGLELNSPLVASASPLNASLDNLKRLESFGAGAVVLPSVFEEQLVKEEELLFSMIDSEENSFGEALSYFPDQAFSAFETTSQVKLVEDAAEALNIPVIASLNGITDTGWTGYARDLENAGASAIELNVYLVPSDLSVSGAAVEKRYVEIVEAVTQVVQIPVSIKIGPYFSSPGHMAAKLVDAGAKGLVLFNRFYQPDINPDTLEVQSTLELSHRSEMRLPLLWIGVLSGQVPASLAATSGVERPEDVIKYLLAGADVVMTTSSLLKHGVEHMEVLVDELREWLAARKLTSPDDIRGKLSHGNVDNPERYERSNYIKILHSW